MVFIFYLYSCPYIIPSCNVPKRQKSTPGKGIVAKKCCGIYPRKTLRDFPIETSRKRRIKIGWVFCLPGGDNYRMVKLFKGKLIRGHFCLDFELLFQNLAEDPLRGPIIAQAHKMICNGWNYSTSDLAALHSKWRRRAKAFVEWPRLHQSYLLLKDILGMRFHDLYIKRIVNISCYKVNAFITPLSSFRARNVDDQNYTLILSK